MPPTKVAIGASGLERPVAADTQAVVLLRDPHPREIAPRRVGAEISEELVAQAGLGGGIDRPAQMLPCALTQPVEASASASA